MNVAALAFAALAIASPATPREDPHIASVERKLGTAVVLAGQPAATRTLAEAMQQRHVPGISIAVIHGGRIAWARGYGVTNAGDGAVTPATRFQAGSISKSIAALGVLRLAAAGRVSLDRGVNDYLTHWTLPDSTAGTASAVTLRGLLSHSAGINVHGFPGYAIGTPVPTVVEILDGKPPANTAPIRIAGTPGAAYSYSGGGYLIAQQLVEDVTRQPFAAWAKRAILAPAGMTASSFAQTPAGPHALAHGADGKTVPGGYHLYPEAAAAGLWTTPSDLARAMLAVSASLSGKKGAILPARDAEAVLVPVTPGASIGFDTGGSGAGQWLAKGGDTEGFAALMIVYPRRGDGAVVMTNGAEGTALAQDVVRAIALAYGWPDFGPRMRRASPLTDAMLTTLPGAYGFHDTDRFTIARDGDRLTIAAPGEAPETLYADVSGALFALSQDVTYVFDAGGAAGRMEVDGDAVPFRKIR